MTRCAVAEGDPLDQALSGLVARLGDAARGASWAVVTGSGWAALGEMGRCLAEVPWSEIPGLGASGDGSGVAGHPGLWRVLEVGGARVHCVAGRRHLYEGLAPCRTTLAVRMLARLGVERLLLTNSAGAVHPRWFVGDCMLIRDHLNLAAPRNPLIGPHRGEDGPRFPDMSAPYDARMGDALTAEAHVRGVRMREGVYGAVVGPNYETPAEAAMLRRLGVDAVGMSTVPEVLAAVRAGLRVAALSLITNSHVTSGPPPSHEEVLDVARRSVARLADVIEATLTHESN